MDITRRINITMTDNMHQKYNDLYETLIRTMIIRTTNISMILNNNVNRNISSFFSFLFISFLSLFTFVIFLKNIFNRNRHFSKNINICVCVHVFLSKILYITRKIISDPLAIKGNFRSYGSSRVYPVKNDEERKKKRKENRS